MIYFQYLFSKDGKESHVISVEIIFDEEGAFFVSIKIESGLRSFETINILYRFSPKLSVIFIVLKQNIKWFNAKRRRQCRLTVKNKNRSN